MCKHPDMRLDHVSYAVSNAALVDTVQRLGSKLGGAFVDGGRHPRFGTRNFILPLANDSYIEVVAPLDHPAASQRPFGQAVQQRVDNGAGWMGWVVSVADITPFEARLGRNAIEGHRQRPDGYDLQWRQLGVKDLLADAQLPFFVEWISPASEHPSHGSSSVRIVKIEIAGDDDKVCEWLGEPRNHPLDDIDVEWISPEDDGGIIAITFDTPKGLVRID